VIRAERLNEVNLTVFKDKKYQLQALLDKSLASKD